MAQEGPSIYIRGTGSYAPDYVLTNEDLARRVDTSDEWIRTRTGIAERRIANNGQQCSDLGVEAARYAIAKAGLDVGDIDLVVVGTLSPDMVFPSTACIIQGKLGLRQQIPAFDISAACSGFVYAMEIAGQMLHSGAYTNALVIGAEKISSVIDWEDRATCVLFGDGAGACVLSRTDEPGVGIIGSMLGADGGNVPLLNMPGGGSALPATAETIAQRQHFLKMNGRELFKHAVRVMADASTTILRQHNLTAADIACVIPHQANIRIIEAIAQRLPMPLEKIFINLDRYGNTSAASIPLALDEALQAGRIKPGDYVLFTAFGAGLTWGASLVKWPEKTPVNPGLPACPSAPVPMPPS